MKPGQSLDFSIIIPTYNRPEALGRCLGSLSRLDFPRDRFEVIVVDDGSTLPAEAVAHRWADTLSITTLRTANGGPAAARNLGARAASGTYLAFTDDDCQPAPGWLTAMFTALSENPGAMAGGRTVNELCGSMYAAASQIIVDIVYEHYNAHACQGAFFASNNLALPAARFRALGGFDASFRTAEDRDFCDRWSGAGHPAIFVSGAVVSHAHELAFGSFFMQHLGYGRGARRFYLAHRLRNPGASSIKGDFYRALPKRLAGAVRGKCRPGRLLFLMAVWQLANTVGFLLETAFPGKGPSPGEGEVR